MGAVVLYIMIVVRVCVGACNDVLFDVLKALNHADDMDLTLQ